MPYNLPKSNCARPPRPKGRGMLRAARFGLDGIQKQSYHRFIWPSTQNNCESASDCQKILLIDLRKAWKPGEGSLHPQPKGWGIRDPPHSLCINKYNMTYTVWVYGPRGLLAWESGTFCRRARRPTKETILLWLLGGDVLHVSEVAAWR